VSNTYTGPVGKDTSMYAMLQGDVVQFKFIERFSHSVVVVSTEWVMEEARVDLLDQGRVARIEPR